MTPDEFIDVAMSSPANAALLSRLPALDLSECYLTAGCLFQPVWNRALGWAADHGIRDYDVFYYDACDLSWDAEDEVIRRVEAITNDLGIRVQTRNQARVHLWYEQRFGFHCPELTSARDGIDRFLIPCTCVGIDVTSNQLYAPNGLQDLQDGVLRLNPINPQPVLFRRKAVDYQTRWPWLTIAD
jgi:uncharacterized protein